MLNITKPTTQALVALSLTLSGCSGGGGESNNDTLNASAQEPIVFTGSTSPAAITRTNADDIGRAAGEAVVSASEMAYSNLPFIPLPTPATEANAGFVYLDAYAAVLSPDDSPAAETEVTFGAANVSAQAGLNIDISTKWQLEEYSVPCDSGSRHKTDPDSRAGTGGTNLSIEFDECLSQYTLVVSGMPGIPVSNTLNGTLFVHDDDSLQRFRFEDFTVVSSEMSRMFDAIVECEDGSCTYSIDSENSDGNVHRLHTFDFTGDAETGINGTATFFHKTYGSVVIDVQELTYGGTCYPHPDSGNISFVAGNGSSGTITFDVDPCDDSGTWTSGGSAGSF